MSGAPGLVAPHPPERIDLLGTGVDALTLDDTVARLGGFVARRERRTVCVANVHVLVEAMDDPALRRALAAADLVTPDGMPLVWLLRRRGQPGVERVYGPDLVLAACRAGLPAGWRHAFVGGAPGVAAALGRSLASRIPGLAVVATLAPPFGSALPDEERRLLDAIDAARPDVVWVGLGAPKQELWMARHRAALAAPVLIGVGAAFDFLSGNKRQAPPWMRARGLEWLFRLASEPRRLGPRYLRTNLRFVARLAGQRYRPRDP